MKLSSPRKTTKQVAAEYSFRVKVAEARDDDTRRKWRKKLDDLLDSRLDLMKMRDGKKKS